MPSAAFALAGSYAVDAEPKAADCSREKSCCIELQQLCDNAPAEVVVEHEQDEPSYQAERTCRTALCQISVPVMHKVVANA